MLLEAGLVVAGSASHLIYFHSGEHHLYVTKYLQLFLAVLATVTTLLVTNGSPLWAAVSAFLYFSIYFLLGLYASLIIYRLFFSPIRQFPGPFGCKLSNLWLSFQLKKLDGHKRLLALHQRYGDSVRVGSSDLSITNPKAVEAVYGPTSTCTKADWYDLTHPMVSMHTTRDKAQHNARRRVWSGAFSDKAVRGYEERIGTYQQQLVDQICAHKGEGVNVTKWFSMYSFDVIGDLAFGKPFDMLTTSKEHWAITLSKDGLAPVGLMFPAWFWRLLTKVPLASRKWWKFTNYCCLRLDERMKVRLDISRSESGMLT